MPTVFPDGKSLLRAILFDMRGYLTALVGHSTTLLQSPSSLPSDIGAWLHSCQPRIARWKTIEAQTRQYCDKNVEMNWEAVIARLGNNLNDVPAAHREAQELFFPREGGIGESVSSMIRALERLSELHQFILTEEYKMCWAKYAGQGRIQ